MPKARALPSAERGETFRKLSAKVVRASGGRLLHGAGGGVSVAALASPRADTRVGDESRIASAKPTRAQTAYRRPQSAPTQILMAHLPL